MSETKPDPTEDNVNSETVFPPILFPGYEPGPFSPLFHEATEMIGKRWNGAIIYCFFHGLKRFSELEDAIPGLSSRMLSERLKELEDYNLIRREVIPERPVRIEYTLTDKGIDLGDVIKAIYRWARKWDNKQNRSG